MNPSRKFGEMLVDRHLLQKDDLEVLLIEEEDTGVPFAQLVVERSLVREEDLLRVFAARVGLEFVDLDEVIFAPDVGVKDRARFAGKPVIASGVHVPRAQRAVRIPMDDHPVLLLLHRHSEALKHRTGARDPVGLFDPKLSGV